MKEFKNEEKKEIVVMQYYEITGTKLQMVANDDFIRTYNILTCGDNRM